MVGPEDADKISMCVVPGAAGQRLDQALASMLPEYSRSQLQQWIKDGVVRLDATTPKQRHRLQGREVIEIAVPPPIERPWLPQQLPLNILYQDDDLIVLNKPAGIVVHPGAGNPDGTLLNALLHHDPSLARVARAGIVHRLDKDTSGLLVVARNDVARRSLTEQLAARSVRRVYLAVVRGVIIAGGSVDAPVGRHSRDRVRMAVTARGRPAVTHYRVAARYRAHTLVRVTLETGRTHQIRVHLAHAGFPIVGDPVYGGRLFVPAEASETLVGALRGFRRQALHAEQLGLVHPVSGEAMEWSTAPPEDFQCLIDALAADAAGAATADGKRDAGF